MEKYKMYNPVNKKASPCSNSARRTKCNLFEYKKLHIFDFNYKLIMRKLVLFLGMSFKH